MTDCSGYTVGGGGYALYLSIVSDSAFLHVSGWGSEGGLYFKSGSNVFFSDNYWGGVTVGMTLLGVRRSAFVNQRVDNCTSHDIILGGGGTNEGSQYNSFCGTVVRGVNGTGNVSDVFHVEGSEGIATAYNLIDGITLQDEGKTPRYIINEHGTAGYVYGNTYTNYVGPAPGTEYVVSNSTAGSYFSNVGMPTADPHVKGWVWSNSGVVTISAG